MRSQTNQRKRQPRIFRSLALLTLTLTTLIASTATSHRNPSDPVDPDTPWRADPTASQVPGTNVFPGERSEIVMFAFHRWSANVAPEDRRADLFIRPAIGHATLHCGAAGSEGPLVWSADLNVERPSGVLTRVRQSEIQPVDQSSGCDVTINDMESLQAAARKRLIYIEYVRDGVRKRGQLFPESVGVQKIDGFVSESSYATADTLTGLWFSERHTRSLDRVRWAAHYRAHWGLDMTLRCGPAGVEGEIVAYLDPPGGRGQLSSDDIVPVDGQGACGMAVNNVASLLEALLRGHLYIAYSPRCDGETEPCGFNVVTARAQFPPYNSDDHAIRQWLSW